MERIKYFFILVLLTTFISTFGQSPKIRTQHKVDKNESVFGIAKKYGVPYIDLNGDERTPVMIRSQNTDIASAIRSAVTQKQAVDYDGTETGSVNLHPNYKAHEYESTFIEAFLRSI